MCILSKSSIWLKFKPKCGKCGIEYVWSLNLDLRIWHIGSRDPYQKHQFQFRQTSIKVYIQPHPSAHYTWYTTASLYLVFGVRASLTLIITSISGSFGTKRLWSQSKSHKYPTIVAIRIFDMFSPSKLMDIKRFGRKIFSTLVLNADEQTKTNNYNISRQFKSNQIQNRIEPSFALRLPRICIRLRIYSRTWLSDSLWRWYSYIRYAVVTHLYMCCVLSPFE